MGTYKASAAESPFKAACHFHDVELTIGAETSSTTKNVLGQLKDANGNALDSRASFFAYLSNDANGDSLITTAHSTGGSIGTHGLAIPLVANKAWQITSEVDGRFDLNFVEAGALSCYLIIVAPDGRLIASSVITHAA